MIQDCWVLSYRKGYKLKPALEQLNYFTETGLVFIFLSGGDTLSLSQTLLLSYKSILVMNQGQKSFCGSCAVKLELLLSCNKSASDLKLNVM